MRSNQKRSLKNALMLREFETLTTSNWHHGLILAPNHTLDGFIKSQPQDAQTLQISHLDIDFTEHSDSSKSR